MLLPQLNEVETTRSTVSAFYGYNHKYQIGDGEFYEDMNMSSELFPALTQRKIRSYRDIGLNINKAVYKNGHLYCLIKQNNETKFCKDYIVDTFITGIDNDATLIESGAYIIIANPLNMASGKVYNTVDGTVKNLAKTDSLATVLYTNNIKWCVTDASGVEVKFYQSEKPVTNSSQGITVSAGNLWVDTSSDKLKMYRYTEKASYTFDWVEVDDYYITIKSDNKFLTNEVTEGDVFTLSCEDYLKAFSFYDGSDYIKANVDIFTNTLKGTHVVSRVEYGTSKTNGEEIITSISFKGIMYGVFYQKTYHYTTIDKTITESCKPITINWYVPKMDVVFENGGRLWGSRFGTNNEGEFVNEVYASAQNNFSKWFNLNECFILSIGTDGKFTGGCSYNGYPYFFKENEVFRISGRQISTFAKQQVSEIGITSACKDSLVVCNDVLYYKGVRGIYAYDGSGIYKISDNIGDYEKATKCISGTSKDKVYFCLDKSMFVYDTKNSIWHRETDEDVKCFTNRETPNGLLYYVDDNTDKNEYSVEDTLTKKENMPWSFTTGIIGMESPDSSYISKINIRAEMDNGAWMRVLIKYNSEGAFKEIAKMESKRFNTTTIPVIPYRCDHFQLKVEGKGNVKIFSITKTIEKGSDV